LLSALCKKSPGVGIRARSDGGRCHSLHECLHLEIFCTAPIIGATNDHNQIRRNKNSESGQQRSHHPRYHIPDESSRNDDWPRRYHRYRNCIKELSLRQPMELAYDPTIEERHNRQSATEHESTCLQKKQKESAYGYRRSWP